MPKVQLAVSPLHGIPMIAPYHSSILLDDSEFFFDRLGLMRLPPERKLRSHGRAKPQILDMGTSLCSARDLAKSLGPLFRPGTYDFVRKNCNSFSDCALFFLVHKRLNAEFRRLDTLGCAISQSIPSLLVAATRGHYRPNRAADGFDLDLTIASLAAQRLFPEIDPRLGDREHRRRRRMSCLCDDDAVCIRATTAPRQRALGWRTTNVVIGRARDISRCSSSSATGSRSSSVGSGSSTDVAAPESAEELDVGPSHDVDGGEESD